MTLRIPVKPELISWALDQAQTSSAQLKNHSQVESWLAGETQPTLKQLQTFADSLHVPFGHLMLSEPPAHEKPLADFRRRGSRSSRYSQELTETIYTQQRRQTWYRDYALNQGLEPLPWVGSAQLSQNPTQLAERLHLEWGFSTASRAQSYSESRREVFSFLEDLGVLVSVSGHAGSNKRPFDSEEFSGFSLSDDLAPVVFVNGKESSAAQIFTMFHELGHLLLGESAVSDDASSSVSSHQSERWCDAFAAAFLMPTGEVESLHLSDFSEDSLIPVARRFRVSALSLLNRLRDLRLISFDIWSNLYPVFEQHALEVLARGKTKKSSGGDFYKVHAYLVGRRFAQAVYRDALSGRTSYPEAHRLLGLPKVQTFNRFAREVGV